MTDRRCPADLFEPAVAQASRDRCSQPLDVGQARAQQPPSHSAPRAVHAATTAGSHDPALSLRHVRDSDPTCRPGSGRPRAGGRWRLRAILSSARTCCGAVQLTPTATTSRPDDATAIASANGSPAAVGRRRDRCTRSRPGRRSHRAAGRAPAPRGGSGSFRRRAGPPGRNECVDPWPVERFEYRVAGVIVAAVFRAVREHRAVRADRSSDEHAARIAAGCRLLFQEPYTRVARARRWPIASIAVGRSSPAAANPSTLAW